nr:hypothetical protein [Methanobrevibacter arboriphilus]
MQLFQRNVVHNRPEQVKTGISILKSIVEDFEDGSLAVRKSNDKDKNNDLDEIIELILMIFDKFHLIARQLRNRYNNRETLDINDEYDVQDLLHALLHIYFEDIRPEEYTPSYAGKSSRIDFLLKDFKIAIEVKMTNKNLKEKEVGTQLIDDIARYSEHTHCETLLCFVYDPLGLIGNPKGLEKDLSKNEKIKVKVSICP